MSKTDLKQQLVTANRILANEGIIQGFGHVSVRVPDTDEFLVARSVSPGLVTEADIVRMDFDGDLLETEEVRTYKETVIHRSIYRHREDVGAVVHHHAPAIMPYTITDVELKPAYHMAALFANGVPTFREYDTDFGHLVVTEAEGDRMATVLGEHRAQLLEGHGANVVGTTLKEAVISTVYFVMNARYQYQAHQLGDPSFYTGPEDSLDSIINDIILAPLAIDRMWEYLAAQLPQE